MEIIKISEPKVLESKNGYYVGRTCLTAHEFPDGNMTSYWDEYDYYYQRGYKAGLKDRADDIKKREPNISAYLRQSMDKEARNTFIANGSYVES